MIGAKDAAVLEKAFGEDRILVTANVGDFETLARARDLHGGIILIEDGELLRDEQHAVLERAVKAVTVEYAAGRDMINRVLRIGYTHGPMFESLVGARSD
jgi:predicted nuclease of predicted toxin-antitoxin system